MQPSEYALSFIRAADDDLYMVDSVIDDRAAPLSGVGFHCQQAAEKLLKAVLAYRGVHFRRTHDLKYLAQEVARSGSPVPADLLELTNLNPFAVELRYELPGTLQDFDRHRTRHLLDKLRQWAAAQITASEQL